MKNFPYNLRARREAFTLLEILIVLAIITTIAVMGAGSYRLARRGIAIDIQSDKIVVLLKPYRDSSKFRDASKSTSYCYGMRLEKGVGPQRVEAPYDNAQRKCGEQAVTAMADWPTDIIITGIETDTIPVEHAVVLFAPPRGRMDLDPSAREIRATIGFENNASNATRTLSISRDTGTIEKTK